MECQTLAEAEVRLGGGRPLADVLREFPRLQDAWDRGRHLRSVRGLGAAAASFAEASHVLHLTEEQFQAELSADPEIRDGWNEARIATAVGVHAALVASAREGKVAAINQVLAALRRDVAQPRVDWRHLTVGQAEEALGVSRQTLHAWSTKHGAPRNADGTVNLPALFCWVLEDWGARRGGPARAASPTATDPLRQAKVEKLEIELDLQRGRLLDRTEVLSGLVARHQLVVSALGRMAAELPATLAHQPPDRMRTILVAFADEVRRSLTQVPEQLRLPPAAAEILRQLLAIIGCAELSSPTPLNDEEKPEEAGPA